MNVVFVGVLPRASVLAPMPARDAPRTWLVVIGAIGERFRRMLLDVYYKAVIKGISFNRKPAHGLYLLTLTLDRVDVWPPTARFLPMVVVPVSLVP